MLGLVTGPRLYKQALFLFHDQPKMFGSRLLEGCDGVVETSVGRRRADKFVVPEIVAPAGKDGQRL